jgi:hypothetical protein
LHADVDAPHVAAHVWLVVLHACPEGQSPATLQPTPVPDSDATAARANGVSTTSVESSVPAPLGVNTTESVHVPAGASDAVHALPPMGTT